MLLFSAMLCAPVSIITLNLSHTAFIGGAIAEDSPSRRGNIEVFKRYKKPAAICWYPMWLNCIPNTAHNKVDFNHYLKSLLKDFLDHETRILKYKRLHRRSVRQ